MTLILMLWHVSPKIREFYAIGMLQSELAHSSFARHCGVHYNTIQSLLMCFRQSGNTKDRHRSICTQNNHIRLVNLRDRFQTLSLSARIISGLRSISSRIVRIYVSWSSHRATTSWNPSKVLPKHRAARLTRLKCHLRFRRQNWANILFTDEYQRERECCPDPCAMQHRPFGEGSVMVWGDITKRGRTLLVVIAG